MKFIEFCKKYYNATNSDFPYRRRTNEHDSALTEVMFGRGNIITQRTRIIYFILIYSAMWILLVGCIVISIIHPRFWILLCLLFLMCELLLWSVPRLSLIQIIFFYLKYKTAKNSYEMLLNNLFTDSKYFNNLYDGNVIKHIYRISNTSLNKVKYSIYSKATEHVNLELYRNKAYLFLYNKRISIDNLNFSLIDLQNEIRKNAVELLRTDKAYEWVLLYKCKKNFSIVIKGCKIPLKKINHSKKMIGVSDPNFPSVTKAEKCSYYHKGNIYHFLVAIDGEELLVFDKIPKEDLNIQDKCI